LLDKKTKDSIYETLGDLNFKSHDFEEAANFYEKGKVKNKLEKCWMKLGDLALHFETPDVAEGYYKKTLKGNQEGIGKIWEKEGDRLFLEKNFKEAANFYEKAKLNDKAKKSWEELGTQLLVWKRGSLGPSVYQKIDAAKCFEKAGEERMAKEIWEKAGDQLLKENNFEKAAECYQHVGLLNLANELYEKTGDLLKEKGKFEEAVLNYEKAGLNKSKSSEELKKLSESYEKSGNGIQAMEMNKKLKRLKDSGNFSNSPKKKNEIKERIEKVGKTRDRVGILHIS